MSVNKRSGSELDPLDPENDIFWEGPEGLKKRKISIPPPPPLGLASSLSKSVDPAVPSSNPTVYRLKPDEESKSEESSISSSIPNCSTTLKRPAGPSKPGKPVGGQKERDLSEPEAKKLKETAAIFGYGNEPLENQIKVNKATDGFRKLYVGALGPNTTERSLEAYFGHFGKVTFCQVIRDRETNQTKGFGFVTMLEPSIVQKILTQSVHVVDCRTIRVSLTHSTKTHSEWRPPDPRKHQDKIELVTEVANIEVREGKVYVGPLPNNCSPNILASHFAQYGVIATSNVSRDVHNTMKKNFGVVCFSETMPVKRVLQNPRHFVNEQYVDVTLSKFAMEVFLSSTTLWLWSLDWSLNKEDLTQFFANQFGPVFRAMHIFNPMTGDKKGYGFVDFVDESNVKKACNNCGNNGRDFYIKGQRGFFGRYLPKHLKRDMMYMEDRFGNLLLKELYQKVPDSGTWGGNKDHLDSLKGQSVKTISCKLPKAMLSVVVGEDGKIIADIARDSKSKISLLKSGPQEDSCMFHILGTPENCKTAQYMMQIKIKEKMAKGTPVRYNR